MKSVQRGDICQICSRKFLYRDAMYELMGKLQMRDLNKKQMELELDREERVFDQAVSNLSKAKQDRKLHARKLDREKLKKQQSIDGHQHALLRM